MPGRDLFADDADRRFYLAHVRDCVERQQWSVLSYCLMSNHSHMLVRTPEPDLGAGMKHVHELHAMRLNRRERRVGHVFRYRFFNKPVTTDAYARGCLRYIARNPVKAGLCASPANWQWSSHRATAGLADPDPILDLPAALAFFGDDEENARRSYTKAVAISDAFLVADLAATDTETWLAEAVDDYRIELAAIAQQLRWSESTAYRRLRASRAARDSEGTVPPRSP